MTRQITIYTLFLFHLFSYGQSETKSSKAEKFKASKIITISQIDLEMFTSVICSESFEYYFEKGQTPQVKIETHENMHNLIEAKVSHGKLRFSFFEKTKMFKKLKITIYYSDDLNLIESRIQAQVYALERLNLKQLTINAFDKSKLFINGDFEDFVLSMENKSKAELNIKSKTTKVSTFHNASLIAMFNSTSSQFDAYQSSSMTIEGESENSTIRTTNGSTFTGKKFKVNIAELTADLKSSIGILSNNELKINATGDASFYIYGSPKVELLKFEDNATVYKKNR